MIGAGPGDARQWADLQAIENLIYAYPRHVDSGDFTGVGRLFANGRFLGLNGFIEGSEAVAQLLHDVVIVYPDGTPRTRHTMANVAITIDNPMRAHAHSYYTVFQSIDGQMPLQPIACGHYEDRFSAQDGTWSFCERRVFIDLHGDLSWHIKS
jgi:SnoaL-like domain